MGVSELILNVASHHITCRIKTTPILIWLVSCDMLLCVRYIRYITPLNYYRSLYIPEWYITEACVELEGVMELYVCTCYVVYLWLILMLSHVK